MTIRKLILVLFVPVGVLFAQTNGVPRNIIIMIGDGMGVSQVTAGRTAKGSLSLERFKTMGLLLTHAVRKDDAADPSAGATALSKDAKTYTHSTGEDYITDSGAAATALSTGAKTYNGAIGVRPDATAVENVFERAKKHGKKTGLVATCSITHATPASFVAHVPSRAMELEIAEQIAAGSTDLLLGGGWGWFLPKSRGGRRTDERNLISLMQQKGYTYVSQDSEFRSVSEKNSVKLLGLFAENHVGPAQERNTSLKEMTMLALKSLSSSKNGFVLMIEGSQIDWAAHDNKSDQVMIEMSDFDDAIGEVVDFADRHPETLVLVTADHETGGYSLVKGSLEAKTAEGKFTTGGHTGAMVPLFAMGPGAEQFGGILQNSDVGMLLLKLLR